MFILVDVTAINTASYSKTLLFGYNYLIRSEMHLSSSVSAPIFVKKKMKICDRIQLHKFGWKVEAFN